MVRTNPKAPGPSWIRSLLACFFFRVFWYRVSWSPSGSWCISLPKSLIRVSANCVYRQLWHLRARTRVPVWVSVSFWFLQKMKRPIIFCAKTKVFFYLHLIGLLLFQSLKKLSVLTKTVSLLLLVTHTCSKDIWKPLIRTVQRPNYFCSIEYVFKKDSAWLSKKSQNFSTNVTPQTYLLLAHNTSSP